MPQGQKSKYERRVHLALKWYYLDNLTCAQIQDRFVEEGIRNPRADDGKYSIVTIEDYVSSKPGEEVREQIRNQHAHTRLQVADRQEELYQRANRAEHQATRAEPVMGMKPVMDKVDGRLSNPKTIPYDWERVEPHEDDWPEWADEDKDIIIRFVEGSRTLEPGTEYPLKDCFGQPEYQQYQVGIQRGEPDRTQRSFLRQEQSQHLTAKGEAMGIYEETINLQGDLGIEADVDVPQELVDAVVGASHGRLKSDTEEDGDE